MFRNPLIPKTGVKGVAAAVTLNAADDAGPNQLIVLASFTDTASANYNITPPPVGDPDMIGKRLVVFCVGTPGGTGGTAETITLKNNADGIVAHNSGQDYVFTASNDRAVLDNIGGLYWLEVEDVTT